MIKKILIVEDEELILDLLSDELSDNGNYDVFCAKDGEEALRITQSEYPDIILLDIQLPKISGYEICKIIKSDLVLSHTKILMVSGMAQNSEVQMALEAGADGFIGKPFNLFALERKVEELLWHD